MDVYERKALQLISFTRRQINLVPIEALVKDAQQKRELQNMPLPDRFIRRKYPWQNQIFPVHMILSQH